MNNVFEFLLDQAKEKESQAIQALAQATTELEDYYSQYAQISQYRQDYWGLFVNRGQEGLTASQYSHLNKFLSQLDETLVRQKESEVHFTDRVDKCRQYLLEIRKERFSYEALIQNKIKKMTVQKNRADQKLLDEFATLSFNRRS